MQSYTDRLVQGVCHAAHNSCVARKRKNGEEDAYAVECGARLADCRRSAGLTQLELARAVRYEPSRIGNYEQGSRRIGPEEALAFSMVFPDYHPAYFMGTINIMESAVLVAMAKSEQSRRKAS